MRAQRQAWEEELYLPSTMQTSPGRRCPGEGRRSHHNHQHGHTRGHRANIPSRQHRPCAARRRGLPRQRRKDVCCGRCGRSLVDHQITGSLAHRPHGLLLLQRPRLWPSTHLPLTRQGGRLVKRMEGATSLYQCPPHMKLGLGIRSTGQGLHRVRVVF